MTGLSSEENPVAVVAINMTKVIEYLKSHTNFIYLEDDDLWKDPVLKSEILNSIKSLSDYSDLQRHEKLKDIYIESD